MVDCENYVKSYTYRIFSVYGLMGRLRLSEYPVVVTHLRVNHIACFNYLNLHDHEGNSDASLEKLAHEQGIISSSYTN